MTPKDAASSRSVKAAVPRKRAARPSGESNQGKIPQKPKRVRLLPHDREEQIVAGAIKFFSEVGFDGQTRELARRLGITQGLLYRYFPDKQSLQERVYASMFEGKWAPAWEEELTDRTADVRSRLVRFYTAYGEIIHTSEWVRTYLFAGLGGLNINRRYRSMLRRRLFPLVVNEVRAAFGLPENPPGVVSDEEDEMMITFHGMMFYEGIRRWVYRIGVAPDPELKLKRQVEMLLHYASDLYGRRCLSSAPHEKTRLRA